MEKDIESLEISIADQLGKAERKVLLLDGAWGIGKTYLYKKHIQEKIQCKKIYISLFGIKDQNELKRKIISSTESLQFIDKWLKGLKSFINLIKQGAGDILSQVDLFEMQLFQETIFVFDDFERLSDDANLKDILGFINLLTEVKGANALIICNSDQIKEKEVFKEFKEKVIFKTFFLDRHHDDIFATIFNDMDGILKEAFNESIRLCEKDKDEFKNIRIIEKIKWNAEYLFKKVGKIPDYHKKDIAMHCVLYGFAWEKYGENIEEIKEEIYRKMDTEEDSSTIKHNVYYIIISKKMDYVIKFIEKGYIDENLFNKYYEDKTKMFEKEVRMLALPTYWGSDEECRKAMEIWKKETIEHSNDYHEFTNNLNEFVQLKDILDENISENDVKKIHKKMIKVLEKESDVDILEYADTLSSLGYYDTRNKQIQECRRECLVILDALAIEKNKKSIQDLADRLMTDSFEENNVKKTEGSYTRGLFHLHLFDFLDKTFEIVLDRFPENKGFLKETIEKIIQQTKNPLLRRKLLFFYGKNLSDKTTENDKKKELESFVDPNSKTDMRYIQDLNLLD